MRTPAGTECPHYYEDFHRGRNQQECRLIMANRDSPPWNPGDCFRCPVPAILRANGSPDLVLTARVGRSLLGLRRSVELTAWCRRHERPVQDPYVGCSLCAQEQGDLAGLLDDGER
ncbi:MAG: hypothetical protein ACE5NC_03475 [Anaerolineae bacterium]